LRENRKWNEIRKPGLKLNFCENSDGSVLISMGNTKIICAAGITEGVPPHAEAKGHGWLTAEYTMLPYSTSPRSKRELIKKDGRSVEIQRLIGRSLRTIVDLKKLQNYTITIDCDVLQADGGTRTASITGASIALHLAISKMLKTKMIKNNPLLGKVAAISIGYVKGKLLMDLDYSEDREADVDMNIVMDDDFNIIEIQGTGEKLAFSVEQLGEMVETAKSGITELFSIQQTLS
jgi:ribonuclease PH